MDVKRYTDVDILAELSKLVDAHVQHYKEDFEYDRRAIAQAAKAELPEDRTLIWFCRECGTHCFRESQAFIRDTREHTTLRFYAEQSGEDITPVLLSPNSSKARRSLAMCLRSISKTWHSRWHRTPSRPP
jgi:DNA-binding MurR/RpiR family transcriptional regulator